MSRPRQATDFPPGLQGGLEHDDESHRIGETGQTGPEAPGDVKRSHPEQGGAADDAADKGSKDKGGAP